MPNTTQDFRNHFEEIALVGIPIDEQETVIQASRDSDVAFVTTTDPTVLTKIKRKIRNPLNEDFYSDWTLYDVSFRSDRARPFDVTSITFACPKKLAISFRNKTERAEMSEERKEAARERFKQFQASRRQQAAETDKE